MSRRQDSFVFEVTTRCNHDCPHCYNAWKNPADYPEGALGTAATLIMLQKLLDETGASLVSLSGGEPLLRPDIPEIIDFLVRRKTTINLITNGSLLTEKNLAQLAPDKISIFELPLLSSERDIHDRMSGAPGAFDKVTEAIADLKLLDQRVVGVFVATKRNLPTWRETIELAVALGVDGLMFNRFNPGGRGRENVAELQAPPEELQRALDDAEELGGRYEIPISCSIAMPPCLIDTSRYERLSFGFCAAGTDRAYYTLDPLGNVRPCNHSTTILGNIRGTSFREMVKSPAMRDFMEARPKFCSGCGLEKECLGGCKAAAEVCCGSAWECDPFLAAYRDRAVKPAPGVPA
ncbi:MAG: radical SAM protein [Planctomycetota bacterium]|jgi:radical SAM protein with 4Fe4S-binding SPASM domain